MSGTQAPRWAQRGPRPWTRVIWFPLCYCLLIGPVVDPEPGPGSVLAWVAAVAAAGAFTGAVLSRYRAGPGPRVVGRVLLVGLALLAVAMTVGCSAAWEALFILLAVGVGVVLVDRTGPFAVVAATVVATGSAAIADADTSLTAGLTVLLAGFGSYAVNQLFVVVAELQRTREELARLAVAQERERFARDLHDLLGHTLSLVVVKAEAVRRLVPRDPAAAVEHAADIERVGREALTDIRHAVSGYRGAGLDRELTSARTALEAAGVVLTLDRPTTAGTLPDDAEILLGWVVREGVTNVVRHARASRCTISLQRTGPLTRLTIDDDGGPAAGPGGPGGPAGRAGSAGATATAQAGAGAGLLGLQERAAALGARLDSGRTATGFRLAVEVPDPTDPASPAGPERVSR